MAKTGEIHHPKSGKHTYNAHFAAFGVAERGVTGVSGKVVSADGTETAGEQVPLRDSLLNPGAKFWTLYFQVQAAQEGKYTLHIYDQNGHEMAFPSQNIVIPRGTVHPAFRGLVISYPQPNDDIPEEFVAYGTTDAGGAVTGTMSNCDPPPDTDIEQQIPPTPPYDWNLYCYISNPNPPCVLTVNQGTAHPTVTGLQF